MRIRVLQEGLDLQHTTKKHSSTTLKCRYLT